MFNIINIFSCFIEVRLTSAIFIIFARRGQRSLTGYNGFYRFSWNNPKNHFKVEFMKVNFTPVTKFIVLIALLAATGCSLIQAPLMEPRGLENSGRDAVLEYGQPASESVLEGLLAGD